MARSRFCLASLSLLILPLTFACSAQDAVEVKAPVEDASPTSHHHDVDIFPLPPAPPLPQGWTVLECDYTNRKTARATPEGSLLGVDVIALKVPPGAVSHNVRFIITESQTRVEATIETDTGQDTFQVPLKLAMSFNRCGPNFHAHPGQRLAIWRYRPDTGWVNLGGTVDNFNQLIWIETTQISRYAVGIG